MGLEEVLDNGERVFWKRDGREKKRPEITIGYKVVGCRVYLDDVYPTLWSFERMA